MNASLITEEVDETHDQIITRRQYFITCTSLEMQMDPHQSKIESVIDDMTNKYEIVKGIDVDDEVEHGITVTTKETERNTKKYKVKDPSYSVDLNPSFVDWQDPRLHEDLKENESNYNIPQPKWDHDMRDKYYGTTSNYEWSRLRGTNRVKQDNEICALDSCTVTFERNDGIEGDHGELYCNLKCLREMYSHV